MSAEPSRDGTRLLVSGPLRLDVDRRELRHGSRVHHLTPKECQLLAAFMQRAGQVLTRQFLMREVWQTGFVADTRTLEVHVHWIRRKIEPDKGSPAVIHTIRGVGYMFQPPDDPGWLAAEIDRPEPTAADGTEERSQSA